MSQQKRKQDILRDDMSETGAGSYISRSSEYRKAYDSLNNGVIDWSLLHNLYVRNNDYLPKKIRTRINELNDVGRDYMENKKISKHLNKKQKVDEQATEEEEEDDDDDQVLLALRHFAENHPNTVQTAAEDHANMTPTAAENQGGSPAGLDLIVENELPNLPQIIPELDLKIFQSGMEISLMASQLSFELAQVVTAVVESDFTTVQKCVSRILELLPGKEDAIGEARALFLNQSPKFDLSKPHLIKPATEQELGPLRKFQEGFLKSRELEKDEGPVANGYRMENMHIVRIPPRELNALMHYRQHTPNAETFQDVQGQELARSNQVREVAVSGNEALSKLTQAIGNVKEVPRNNREVLGNNREVLGNSREVLGNSRQVLGNSREVLGNSREVLKEDQGISKEVFGIQMGHLVDPSSTIWEDQRQKIAVARQKAEEAKQRGHEIGWGTFMTWETPSQTRYIAEEHFPKFEQRLWEADLAEKEERKKRFWESQKTLSGKPLKQWRKAAKKHEEKKARKEKRRARAMAKFPEFFEGQNLEDPDVVPHIAIDYSDVENDNSGSDSSLDLGSGGMSTSNSQAKGFIPTTSQPNQMSSQSNQMSSRSNQVSSQIGTTTEQSTFQQSSELPPRPQVPPGIKPFLIDGKWMHFDNVKGWIDCPK